MCLPKRGLRRNSIDTINVGRIDRRVVRSNSTIHNFVFDVNSVVEINDTKTSDLHKLNDNLYLYYMVTNCT